jgi:hypothetical protein
MTAKTVGEIRAFMASNEDMPSVYYGGRWRRRTRPGRRVRGRVQKRRADVRARR